MSSNNWKTLKLKEICSKIGSGATPRGGKESYSESGEYALIRSQNILDFTFSFDGLAYIDKEQASRLENVAVEKRDVLLNITGDSVARVCQVPSSILPARVNQHVSIIRPYLEISTPEYIKYFLLNPRFKEFMLGLSTVGATRNALTKGMIENFEITFPNLKIQDRITSILSSLDEKIELNNQTNQTLEALAQTLFKEWFVNFNFPLTTGKMQTSELGEIPIDWKVISLDELMEFQGGSQPPSEVFKEEFEEGYIRLVQIRDYESNSHTTYIPQTDKLRLCDKKDIMIARYGASVGRILFGLVGAYNVALVKVVPHKQHYREYLRIYLKSNLFQERLLAMSGRSAQAGFNKDDFRSFRLAFPNNEDILIQFEKTISPFIDKILNNNEESIHLAGTRNVLLPNLLKGEIEIT